MILKDGQESVRTLSSASVESSSTGLTKISDTDSTSSTSTSSLRSLAKSESQLPPLPISVPQQLAPPRYSMLEQPHRRITYTFIPQVNPANSMIMEPLRHDHIILPSFYISVNMNCFSAFSYITTIRRGGWDGEIIGDFELDIHGARKIGTVSLFGCEHVMDDIFGVKPKMFRVVSYHWRGRGRFGQNKSTSNLCWEEISADGSPSSILSCYPEQEHRERTEIACLTVPKALRRPGSRKEFTRVDISLEKCSCVEEIVISLLIVERLRRTNIAANRNTRWAA